MILGGMLSKDCRQKARNNENENHAERCCREYRRHSLPVGFVLPTVPVFFRIQHKSLYRLQAQNSTTDAMEKGREMSRYTFFMPSDCEWPFEKCEPQPVKIAFDLAPHFITVIDALIEKQFEEAGNRWTRDECARRLVTESLRQWRDRTKQ